VKSENAIMMEQKLSSSSDQGQYYQSKKKIYAVDGISKGF
jgi:hypothetical protein